jgi:hypothetical protein
VTSLAGFAQLARPSALVRLGFERLEQFADGVHAHDRIAQGQRRVELVVIVPAHALPRQVSRLDQVREDSVRRPLCDADGASDVLHPHLGLFRHCEQNLSVIRHERPRPEGFP